MSLGSTESSHYCEGSARVQTGPGFFRADSRPARDLGVLLARCLGGRGHLRVLDLMAGCGIRSLRYGLEAEVGSIVSNDADPDRSALIHRNLRTLPRGVGRVVRCERADDLLAELALAREGFNLVDLDAFGCPSALVPLVVPVLHSGGCLYLASSDGRGSTGHDRVAAIRRLGAAARAHPASWELALRLQLALVARSAWAQGRGVVPLVSFSDGRTFRTAVRLDRSTQRLEERNLGLLSHCPVCGDQQVQTLHGLRGWDPCPAGCRAPLSVSGPLWIGGLQDPTTLADMVDEASRHPHGVATPARRLLDRLRADPGDLPRVWPLALIGRQLGTGPPSLSRLIPALRRIGHRAGGSGIMAGQIRSDAPWDQILTTAARLEGPDRADC